MKKKQTDKHGVSYVKDKAWKAKITLDLGTYETPEEAARAHDLAAILLKPNADLNNDEKSYSASDIRSMLAKLLV